MTMSKQHRRAVMDQASSFIDRGYELLTVLEQDMDETQRETLRHHFLAPLDKTRESLRRWKEGAERLLNARGETWD